MIGNIHRKTTKQFIEHANIIHNYLYDYTETVYKNSSTKIKIRCEKHRSFWQLPAAHLTGQGCPKCAKQGYSQKAIKWLTSIEGLEEIKIPGTNLRADGYDPKTNTVFEFHGCFFHGCPICFKQTDRNAMCNKTYGELYKNTIDREKSIKDKGFNLVRIWEHNWDALTKHPFMKNYLKKL